jgi:hypothetical protein
MNIPAPIILHNPNNMSPVGPIDLLRLLSIFSGCAIYSIIKKVRMEFSKPTWIAGFQ